MKGRTNPKVLKGQRYHLPPLETQRAAALNEKYQLEMEEAQLKAQLKAKQEGKK